MRESDFVPTAPCATCGERLAIATARRCSFTREVPTRVKAHDIRHGDRVVNPAGAFFRITAIEAVDDGRLLIFTYQPCDKKSELRPWKKVTKPVVLDMPLERLQPGPCRNYCCERCLRELSPDHVICAECWPLQLALVKGAA